MDTSYERKVQAQYDRVATLYDRLWKRYVKETLGFFKQRLPLSGDEHILDVACGTGELERMLLADYPDLHVVGVDLSENMLAVARKKLHDQPHVRFEQASADDLPFPDEAFGLVTCANAFHYFPHPEGVLQDMRRVLRPGGQLALIDWSRDYWMCKLMDAYLKWLDPAYRQCYTQHEVLQLLRGAGFTVHEATFHRLLVVWGLMLIRATPGPPFST